MEELKNEIRELKAINRQLSLEAEKKDAKIRKLGLDNFNLRDILKLRREHDRERLYIR